ncbi:hypothetical protein ACSBR2_025004 [Camellia fascicularis]
MKGVGQRFAQGVVEFRDALSNVHARVENYSKAFVIKQFDDVHTCGSSFRTIKYARMTSSMIGGLISSDIRNKALTSVSEVVCDFKDYYGTEVSYQRAWMGVEKVRGLVFGDYSSSFDDLRWYVDAANAGNPGSVFDMEFDIDSKGRHFKCLFFAFEACIHGFKYYRPVLMLDGTFLKGRHKGCLLAATAKNDNQGILTPKRDIAFVTDRHGSLLKALAEVFPFSSYSFCLMHLKTNLKTYLSVKSRESKEYLLTLFSRCAYAPTIELFNELFEELRVVVVVVLRSFLRICLMSVGVTLIFKARVPSMWKPNVVVDDDVVLSPLCKRLAGRPRTERIPSKGEIKRIRCSSFFNVNDKYCPVKILVDWEEKVLVSDVSVFSPFLVV